MSDVVHLTSGGFDKATTQPLPVLIDFWAPWCGPCRMQGPMLDEVAKAAGATAIVAKVNVDEEPQLAARFGVQSIPTLIVLRNGKIKQRMVGLQPVHTLMVAVQEASV